MDHVRGHWTRWKSSFAFAVLLIIVFKLVDHLEPIWLSINNFISIITPFIVGIVIAYFLNVPCSKLSNLFSKNQFLAKYSKGLSVLTIYLSILFIISVVISYVFPILAGNISELILLVPIFYQRTFDFVTETLESFDFIDFDSILSSFNIESLLSNLGTRVGSIGIYATVITAGIVNTFLSIIISIYVLLYKENLLELANRITKLLIKKESSFKAVKTYVHKSNEIFYKFIYTQFLDACILGTLATIMLSVIGVRYALTLGILLGVCNMIPYFGSIFASVITTVITLFTGGPTQAVVTGLSLLVLQQIDGNIIGPKLMGSSLSLNPIWIILSITIGGSYFGVVGMFVSVPVAAMLKVIINNLIDVYEKKLALQKNQEVMKHEKNI